ncbi:hypothetical protein FPQ18DRAFT_155562 [Pyronema domesticum]|nr:hypothetical protein FPQ18DRAFT_155562 [Pyronema domesticum]
MHNAIALKANEDDIRKYVSRELEMDENYDEMDDSFKDDIQEAIVRTADDMFLLPALQIQAVLEQTSIAGRRAALKTMPKELDEAFQVTIERIRRQSRAKSMQGEMRSRGLVAGPLE